MGVKTAHVSQCSKSRTFTKVIDFILGIKSCEQQCVVIKRLLQSNRLKQHMVTIGIDQFLTNCAMY